MNIPENGLKGKIGQHPFANWGANSGCPLGYQVYWAIICLLKLSPSPGEAGLELSVFPQGRASFLEHSTGSIDIELHDHQTLTVLFIQPFPLHLLLISHRDWCSQAGTSEWINEWVDMFVNAYCLIIHKSICMACECDSVFLLMLFAWMWCHYSYYDKCTFIFVRLYAIYKVLSYALSYLILTAVLQSRYYYAPLQIR